MRIPTLTTAALLSSTLAAPYEPRTQLRTDALAADGLSKLKAYTASLPPSKCTLENAAVRKEWSTLDKQEKKDYIKAVQCLYNNKARTPPMLAPGARNRYDDFVATHISQTLSIHGTGNFLTWHRYFTWAYEQALRNECGYKGYQPYYNWPQWASDPASSPLFDGSETSMSGDGKPIPGRNNTCIPFPTQCGISLPPGNGGGCLTSGPFKDWKTHLGPVSPVVADPKPNPDFTGLGYNPRCLRRDISAAAAQGWTQDSDVAALVEQSASIGAFAARMQGDFPAGFLGVHTAGHFTMGGDPGGDLFASPGDPAFYFHHAMIDRVYWTWQNAELETRLYAVGGTLTLNNQPPSRNASLEDRIGLGYVGVPDVSIREVSSTLAGPFCYIYA